MKGQGKAKVKGQGKAKGKGERARSESLSAVIVSDCVAMRSDAKDLAFETKIDSSLRGLQPLVQNDK